MKIIWIEEAYPSAVEGLLFDNADESDEDEVDEYFRDYEWRTWLKFEWHLHGPLLFVFDILEI